MFNLDPGKLLVIAVVAIILLGPDKLPQFARQVGGAWRSFNEFRHRMEAEVRNTMPDLPPTSEIARLARSPSALLNHLSTMSDDESGDEEGDKSGDESAAEEPDGSFQAPLRSDAGVDAGADPVSTNGSATHEVALDGTPWPSDVETAAPADPAPAPEAIVPGDPTLN